MAQALAEAGADCRGYQPPAGESGTKRQLLARTTGRRVSALPSMSPATPQVEHMMRTVVNTFGRLDILVNNAGIHPQTRRRLSTTKAGPRSAFSCWRLVTTTRHLPLPVPGP